jgi:hypothetical protein
MTRLVWLIAALILIACLVFAATSAEAVVVALAPV